MYLLRINDKCFPNELYGLLRHPPEQVLGEGELALRYVKVRLLLCLSCEGRVAAEQDVGEHAHGPDVRREGKGLV